MQHSHAHESIRQLVCRYARAVDRLDVSLLDSCFTRDVQIIVPGLPGMDGPATAANIVAAVQQRFTRTQHRVFNTLYTVSGSRARGETYCSALHLLPADADGKVFIFEMAIRYQDEMLQADDSWKISKRSLVVDWEERRELVPG